jgi:hypothetical protein
VGLVSGCARYLVADQDDRVLTHVIVDSFGSEYGEPEIGYHFERLEQRYAVHNYEPLALGRVRAGQSLLALVVLGRWVGGDGAHLPSPYVYLPNGRKLLLPRRVQYVLRKNKGGYRMNVHV